MLEKGSRLIARFFLYAAFIASASMNTGCVEDHRDAAIVVAPEGIVERDAFILLLADIQLIEAASKNRVWRNDDVEKKLVEAYLEVFNRHSVSKEDFEKSHTWWWNHPVAMKSLLLEVTERISQIESQTDK
ncbi:MAG TPA: DUF4296 domain-containing protein [Flavobacteriales bacterium]|nr:DUF4296 domain-containing protein [Flavobacteriales bacterium]